MALPEIDLALQYDPHHLLSHYQRGLLLGRMGRSTEASFESQWLNDYLTAFAPALLPAIAPLSQNYPFDSSQLSNWMLYPLLYHTDSPGGRNYTDLTQTAPRLVQLAIFEQYNQILAIDLDLLHFSIGIAKPAS